MLLEYIFWKLSMSNLKQLEQETFKAIQRIFPCEEELKEKIYIDNILEHFSLPQQTQKHVLIRIVGQSGSGKSSQLLPALEESLKNCPYIKISVSDFARFHPRFEWLQKNCPGQMREKTNGFALKTLIVFYQYCIQKKINIILDMTLLEPEIDFYLMMLAKEMGYTIQTHVLCVPKKISNLFIKLRQKKTHRQVNPSSSDYFFNALIPSLKNLLHASFFTYQDTLILWNHTNSYPIKKTHFYNTSIIPLVEKYRNTKNRKIKNSSKLLKNKIHWMKLLVKDIKDV